MQVAAQLMESGANQQLVSKNITPDIENEMITLSSKSPSKTKDDGPVDPTKLEIEHDGEPDAKEDSDKEVETTVTAKEHTLLDDLKAAEASLAQAGAETIQEDGSSPLKVNSSESETAEEIASELEENTPKPEGGTPQGENSPIDSLPPVAPEIKPETHQEDSISATLPTIPDPSDQISKINDDFASEAEKESEASKYGHMLEEALDDIKSTDTPKEESVFSTPSPDENPASASAPVVPTQPEINGVPEMNYMPMPDETILPPPPAPPIESATPMPEPTPEPLGPQPAMQDQVYTPQASDPSAFKIPGM